MVSIGVDPILGQAKEPHKKRKIKCSVCFKEGHRRNKCDAPAAKIWRNLDFYAPNHQYMPQEESELHVLSAQENWFKMYKVLLQGQIQAKLLPILGEFQSRHILLSMAKDVSP
ncbi:hypothetical protein ABFS83_02G120400 [Erythranthe nasuta]